MKHLDNFTNYWIVLGRKRGNELNKLLLSINSNSRETVRVPLMIVPADAHTSAVPCCNSGYSDRWIQAIRAAVWNQCKRQWCIYSRHQIINQDSKATKKYVKVSTHVVCEKKTLASRSCLGPQFSCKSVHLYLRHMWEYLDLFHMSDLAWRGMMRVTNHHCQPLWFQSDWWSKGVRGNNKDSLCMEKSIIRAMRCFLKSSSEIIIVC